MFRDEVTILCRSAYGGSGSAKLAKKKYQPLAGPAGGNGGDGGDVFFIANAQLEDIAWFSRNRDVKAGAGEDGGDNGKTGHKGKNLELNVPSGTRLFNFATGLLLAELIEDGQSFLALQGGKGGLGNIALASATRRAPTTAQPGLPGEEMSVSIVYRVPVDFAIIDGSELNFDLFSKIYQKTIENQHIYYQAPLKHFAVLNYNKFSYVVLPYNFRCKQNDDGKILEYSSSFLFLQHLYYSRIAVLNLPESLTISEKIVQDFYLQLNSVDYPNLEAILYVSSNPKIGSTITEISANFENPVEFAVTKLSELETRLVELLKNDGK